MMGKSTLAIISACGFCIKDAYISVVANTLMPDRVQAWARLPDHLAALLPGCDEWVVAAALR